MEATGEVDEGAGEAGTALAAPTPSAADRQAARRARAHLLRIRYKPVKVLQTCPKELWSLYQECCQPSLRAFCEASARDDMDGMLGALQAFVSTTQRMLLVSRGGRDAHSQKRVLIQLRFNMSAQIRAQQSATTQPLPAGPDPSSAL